jgi:hypothetical protein
MGFEDLSGAKRQDVLIAQDPKKLKSDAIAALAA